MCSTESPENVESDSVKIDFIKQKKSNKNRRGNGRVMKAKNNFLFTFSFNNILFKLCGFCNNYSQNKLIWCPYLIFLNDYG